MKVIVNMSVALNGIAARDTDTTDFLTHGEFDLFLAATREAGALAWGRRTHEVVIRNYGIEVLQLFNELGRVVVSKDAGFEVQEGWKVATSPQQVLEILSADGHGQLLLGGGPTLNTSFAKAGLIDEVVFNIGSVLVGRGLPVFAPQEDDAQLTLLDMKRGGDEVVTLRYRVGAPT